jgi:hypothetical protein
VLRQVGAAAGLPRGQVPRRAAPLLKRILETSGGLPIFETRLSEAARDERALTLLHDAVRHVLGTLIGAPASPGAYLHAANHAALAREASASPQLDVNAVDANALAKLTPLGRELAQRIVDERMRGGRYASLTDMEKRVRGVGPAKIAQLQDVLTAGGPSERLRPALAATRDLAHDLQTLLKLHSAATPAQQLESALEQIALECATQPHPATTESMVRDFGDSPLGINVPADWIGVLWGDDYWQTLPDLLRAARKQIDLCMFHIALGSETHPTSKLFAALRTAHRRGVKVRVLVDRDREQDPYMSNIINSGARQAFKAAHIDVRADSSHRLLHSKFLLIDRELSIVGSHNWTAGSYFDFDDLSLAVRSTPFAAQLGARFDKLWKKAPA